MQAPRIKFVIREHLTGTTLPRTKVGELDCVTIYHKTIPIKNILNVQILSETKHSVRLNGNISLEYEFVIGDAPDLSIIQYMYPEQLRVLPHANDKEECLTLLQGDGFYISTPWSSYGGYHLETTLQVGALLERLYKLFASK